MTSRRMATKETVTIAVRYVLTATKPVDKTIPFDKQSHCKVKIVRQTIGRSRIYITLMRTKNISSESKTSYKTSEMQLGSVLSRFLTL